MVMSSGLTLSGARQKAFEYRKLARAGGDPRALRPDRAVPTFAEAAKTVIGIHEPGWKDGGKTAAQWQSSLRDYVMKRLGKRTIWPPIISRATARRAGFPSRPLRPEDVHGRGHPALPVLRSLRTLDAQRPQPPQLPWYPCCLRHSVPARVALRHAAFR